jgi:hypothetical protein
MGLFSWAAIIGLVFSSIAAGSASERRVVVTGGSADAKDWVVTQSVDVSSWVSVPTRAAVIEIDSEGGHLGQKISQLDLERTTAVVSWVVDGVLPAGKKRFFRIAFGEEGLNPSGGVGVEKQDGAIIVNGTGFSLRHDQERAGLLAGASVGRSDIEIRPADYVGDDALNYYNVENDLGAQVRIVARGPLRTTIEVRARYFRIPVDPAKAALEGRDAPADEKGAAPPSNARVRYRYSTLLGMPVTRVDAFMEQDSAKAWREVEVCQFTFDRHFQNWALNIPSRLGGKNTGVLEKKGYWYTGDRWAAVFDRDFLLGISGRAGILDVKEEKSSCLFRSAPTSWKGLQHRRTVHLFFGSGPQDLERFKSLAAVLWDPPRTRIVVPDDVRHRIERARTRIDERRQQMATAAAEAYIATSLRLVDAEQRLREARALADRGNFRGALAGLEGIGSAAKQLVRQGGFLVGRVGSTTVLANRGVAFCFADAKSGAGLVAIADLDERRLLLGALAPEARLWEITAKTADETQVLASNRHGTARISVDVDDEKGEAVIRMDWDEVPVGKRPRALSVALEGVLHRGEKLLRAKIEARTLVPDLGLVKVVFPDVTGLKPISEKGERDWMINPSTTGYREKSPLRTGKDVGLSVPPAMQFMAMTDGRRGFYCAEQDPTSAEKYFLFDTGTDRSTLDLRVEHPVLDWGATTLQRSYSLPGPVVIGPFSGHWYDACRIYRQWALTAPWCRGGPLAVRKDVPQWMKDLPSVRAENLGTATTFEYQKKLEGLPSGAHIYGWMARPGFHGGEAPYPQYRPKYGDEWFRSQVKKAQEADVRIIPYTNGILWYTGLDSFREKGSPGAVKEKGGSYRRGNYGGKRFAIMCPGSTQWRNTVTGFCLQMVEDGVDGVYLDQLSTTTPASIWGQCWDKTHGHPILGGNWWAEAVRGYMKQVRTTCRQVNPEVIFTSEGICEALIDSFDIFLESSWGLDSLPLFAAVYGGYAMSFGNKVYGEEKKEAPASFLLSRWFIWGQKPGWGVGFMPEDSPPELKAKGLYRSYLLCYDRFARPFLTYGQMMRPPRLDGELGKLVSRTGKKLDIPSVEAMAWRTFDRKRLGVFIANHSDARRRVTWDMDLSEELGWQVSDKIEIRRWDHEALELETLGSASGGPWRRTDELEPYELLVLELTKVPQ